MKNANKVLRTSPQNENLLQIINSKEFENKDWNAMIKKALNRIFRERPNEQTIGDIVGRIANLDHSVVTSGNILYKYFSPGSPDMPPLNVFILLMIACGNDLPLRIIADELGLALVRKDSVQDFSEVVQ